jgi:hypothetical protein
MQLGVRLGVLFGMLAPAGLGGQLPDFVSGSRLRVTTEFGRLTGSYTVTVNDSMEIVEASGAPRRTSVFRIERVDVSLGTTRRAGARKGAKVGGIIGAVAAAIYFVSAFLTDDFVEEPFQAGTRTPLNVQQALVTTVGGLVAGSIVGGLVGSSRGAEEWRSVYAAPQETSP